MCEKRTLPDTATAERAQFSLAKNAVYVRKLTPAEVSVACREHPEEQWKCVVCNAITGNMQWIAADIDAVFCAAEQNGIPIYRRH